MEAQYNKRGYLLEDFRLFHLQDKPKSEIDFHYHEFHKLLLLISGSGGYCVDGNRYAVVPGDMVLVGSRCVHRPEFEDSYERIILYVSPEFLRQSSTKAYSLEHCFSGEQGHVFSTSSAIRALAEQLEQELSTNAPGCDIAAKGLILKLMVEIGRTQLKNAVTTPPPPKNERITQLLQYIEEHLSEELTIEALAAQTFLSKYHLMRLFREQTGQTIHSYITDRRLLYARNLIHSGFSATNACFQSGFKSYSSFTRAYVKRFGTTPTGRTGKVILAEETYE